MSGVSEMVPIKSGELSSILRTHKVEGEKRVQSSDFYICIMIYQHISYTHTHSHTDNNESNIEIMFYVVYKYYILSLIFICECGVSAHTRAGVCAPFLHMHESSWSPAASPLYFINAMTLTKPGARLMAIKSPKFSFPCCSKHWNYRSIQSCSLSGSQFKILFFYFIFFIFFFSSKFLYSNHS